jgi:Icc-related predicted phosphoesterase
LKIIFISDTHGLHDQLILPKGDMIIHCGDVSKRGTETEITSFLTWYEHLDFKYKIFIAGNHDFFFEKTPTLKIDQLIPENIIYLNDSGITIEGINIWGSPIQPWFHDWAFNRQRGKKIKKHWDLIPNDTDILVTHGPPQNILDRTAYGEFVGCENLKSRIQEVKPRIHAFGHIHEGYGELLKGSVRYINASVLNLRYQMSNEPVEYIYKK